MKMSTYSLRLIWSGSDSEKRKVVRGRGRGDRCCPTECIAGPGSPISRANKIDRVQKINK